MASTARTETVEGVEVAAPSADGFIPDGEWTRVSPSRIDGRTAVIRGEGGYLLSVIRDEEGDVWSWAVTVGDQSLPSPGMGGIASTLAEAMSAAESVHAAERAA